MFDSENGSRSQMDDTELKSIIHNELSQALGADGGKLSFDRRKAIEAYDGGPRGDERDGQSQVISRNVLEVVEWSLPILLRVFASSDVIFEYEPVRPEEEADAAAATQFINYVFLRDNQGFLVLYDWIKTALLEKVSYVKAYWSEEDVYSTSTFSGLTELEYQQITGTDDVEVIEERAYDNPDPNMMWFTQDDPNPKAPKLYDLKVRVWQTEGRVKIEHIVPEEILVSRRSPSLILDGKHFVCHRSMKRRYELVQMGFDEDMIDEAIGANELDLNSERIARFKEEEDWPYAGGDRTDPAMEMAEIEESYIRVDYDGDNVAELRRIVTANSGQVILSNEMCDEVPIVALCPLPFPGKHIGMSVADLVMDLQDINTTLMRQVLNNLYYTNTPRTVVEEGAMTDDTVDDILDVRPAGIIRVSNAQGVVPMTVPFVAGATMPFFEFLNNVQEVRTGVSRQNQTLSVDDLNKHASGAAIGMAQQAANQRIELIARIFAETGMKQLGKLLLGLVIRHQQKGRIVRLTGNWVNFDPRGWRDNMDVSVNVGLGSGSRDQVLAHLMSVLQIQQTIVAAQKGIQGPLVTGDNVYAVVQKIIENAGFKGMSFFTDPKSQPPQQGQQQPDPEMVKAQVQNQALVARTQADLAAQKARVELELQLETVRANHQAQLAEMKQEHEMKLEKMREEARMTLEMAKLHVKAQVEASQPAPTT